MTFHLITKRLELLPLDLHQLRMQVLDTQSLASSLGLVLQPSQVADPELQPALEQMVRSLGACPQDWPWNTNWLIISLIERAFMGGCCFHGPPNPAGEVEVGYGLDAAFRGRGFMTETLQSLIAWALSQPHIVAIIAETEKANLPSQRVLGHLGMRVTSETGTSLWWRLERCNCPPSKENKDGSA